MRLEDQALPSEEAESRVAESAESLVDDRALGDDRR